MGLIARIRAWLQRRRERRCRDRGHVPAIRTRRGYRKPDWDDPWGRRLVAYRVKEDTVYCLRCGDVLAGPQEVERVGIHGLTLSGRDMETMERDGVVWTD